MSKPVRVVAADPGAKTLGGGSCGMIRIRIVRRDALRVGGLSQRATPRVVTASLASVMLGRLRRRRIHRGADRALASVAMLCTLAGCAPEGADAREEAREEAPRRGATDTPPTHSRETTVPPPFPSPDAVGAALDTLLARESAPPPLTAAGWHRVRALYAAGDTATRPLWVGVPDGAARARALLDAWSQAPEHGVALTDAARAALTGARVALEADARGAAVTARAAARADVLLTATFAHYGEIMLTGQVTPRAAGADWHIATNTVDVDSALARTLRTDDLEAALARLAPQEDGYATLRRALARYRAYVDAGGWPSLGLARTLRPGDALPGGARLRERLAAEGWLDGGAKRAMADSTYGPALAGAVARFQARHGLAVDSVVGPRTRAALDVPAQRRLRQIAANLERYRWLPPDLGTRYVVVNVPAFRLDAYDGERRVLTMRVVVGSELETRQTPIFSDSMRYVQFGPYWNVPTSIARNEILPKARADRGYLTQNDYEVVRGWGDDAPVVDPWRLSDAALSSSRYRIRQRPGPQNALGRVKFMFPNDYHVYLHDTPAQALFDQRVRAASHGCVRVADPAALAEFVLAGRPAWTAPRIRETLAAGDRVRVNLPRAIPVYLIYLTAFEQDGELAFRPDRYDRDAPLVRTLGAVPPIDAGADVLQAVAERLPRAVGPAAGSVR